MSHTHSGSLNVDAATNQPQKLIYIYIYFFFYVIKILHTTHTHYRALRTRRGVEENRLIAELEVCCSQSRW